MNSNKGEKKKKKTREERLENPRLTERLLRALIIQQRVMKSTPDVTSSTTGDKKYRSR